MTHGLSETCQHGLSKTRYTAHRKPHRRSELCFVDGKASLSNGANKESFGFLLTRASRGIDVTVSAAASAAATVAATVTVTVTAMRARLTGEAMLATGHQRSGGRHERGSRMGRFAA
jgi:hypothetical protein